MRYLVLSDIHGNLEALETCLADAAARKYDEVLILGDVVGYGADPNAVIACVQDLKPKAMVRGNHDKIAIDLSEADDFNATARNAARWTYQALSPANRNRIWFEMRREVKRARKERKAEEREAIREWRARQRAAVQEESAA